MNTEAIRAAVEKAIGDITDAVDCLTDEEYMEALIEINNFCESCVEIKGKEAKSG